MTDAAKMNGAGSERMAGVEVVVVPQRVAPGLAGLRSFVRADLASALFGSVARDVTRQADRPAVVCPLEPGPALRLDARAA